MFGIDWLTLLSAAALAFSVLTYVLLDGTDLGVGMLMGANRRTQDREVMVLSILPVWDANETWLVLGGGGLLALFPLAYAILLPALYEPLLVMLMALILRAVALEFREYVAYRHLADALLLAGSLLATLCQGLVLGTLVQGVPHDNGQYSGSGWPWLGPFPLFCALALVAGYLWLGACWLYWRTEGDLHRRSARQAKCLAVLAMALLAGVLAWSLSFDERYVQRLAQPWVMGPAALAMLALLAGFYMGFGRSRHCMPLFLALGVVVVAFGMMLVEIFPLVVPPSLTLTQAASSASTQKFMLLGFALIVPVTLAYNTVGFRVFAGKIRPPRR
jgi:cytochrome d ubiquinol oxidase subunit II